MTTLTKINLINNQILILSKLNKNLKRFDIVVLKHEVNGKKEVLEIKIDQETLDKEDIEMLQDILQVAINEANKKVDADTEKRLGKYTKGMPGLF